MTNVIDTSPVEIVAYVLLLAGPLGLVACLGGAQTGRNLRLFAVGMLAFLLAWGWIGFGFEQCRRLGIPLALGSPSHVLAFSASAGLFEELARFVAILACLRWMCQGDRRAVVAYAAGHAGGECLMVAMSRLNTSQMHGMALLSDAGFHLVGALIVQSCFTAVVWRAALVWRAAPGRSGRLLAVAMLWHFLQDVICMTATPLLGEATGRAVILGVNFGLYPCLLAWLLVGVRPTESVLPATSPDLTTPARL